MMVERRVQCPYKRKDYFQDHVFCYSPLSGDDGFMCDLYSCPNLEGRYSIELEGPVVGICKSKGLVDKVNKEKILKFIKRINNFK